MRVLLISPLPGLDPACGDVVYTQTLLNNPPDGVEYDSYADALSKGTLQEHGRWNSIKRNNAFVAELGLAASMKLLNICRNRHLLLWEPFRFFSAKPGIYDLVHVHVFSTRFFDLSSPFVVSNAISHHYLYSDARQVSPPRLAILEFMERALCAITGANHPSYSLPDATRAIAFTEFMRQWYLEQRLIEEQRIDVVPIFLPPAPVLRARNERPYKIGFIAKDFEAKGGSVLLKAFELVKHKYPQAELHIVGCQNTLTDAEEPRQGIHWQSYIPREQLLNEVIPSFDMLAYPTNFDGLPLVVLETMAAGVPIISSNYPSMVEVLQNGEAGLLCKQNDHVDLSEKISMLFNPADNRKYSVAAKERFDNHYSAEVVRPKLLASYNKSIERSTEQ